LSAHNYLDDLDNLLDDPKSNLTSAPLAKAHQESPSDVELSSVAATPSTKPKNTTDEAHQASQTWADVIESASRALHDGTQLAQEATRKNIELAKEQQESIKELADAASGWRHATRQAVQEVSATKKNIIILTVISALIAVAGFGTTIGVMLQSRASFVSMSNAILENVDEHQTIVSKTLTLKMDELASTIEQMQASIDQLNTNRTNTINVAKAPIVTNSEESTNNMEDSPANDTLALNTVQPETTKSLVAQTQPPSLPPSSVSVANPVSISTTSSAPIAVIPEAPHTAATSTMPTAEAWQQLLTQVDQLQQQLQQIEQNAIKQAQAQNQQWQQVATQIDEKLAARLAKLPTTANETTKTPTSVTAVVDTKPIMDQLTRLRQEMAELRLLQQSLKEQLGQVKQTVTESANKPYQYRLPQEGERYPR
jgi:TolA-binding protein